jgi:hypothetical protein
MNWVINGKLARSARPGYPSRYVEKGVVLSAIEYWKSHGIRSVICLLTFDELLYYPEMEGDLLDLYQEGELITHVIPVENHKEHPLDADEMDAVWMAVDLIIEREN